MEEFINLLTALEKNNHRTEHRLLNSEIFNIYKRVPPVRFVNPTGGTLLLGIEP